MQRAFVMAHCMETGGTEGVREEQVPDHRKSSGRAPYSRRQLGPAKALHGESGLNTDRLGSITSDGAVTVFQLSVIMRKLRTSGG